MKAYTLQLPDEESAKVEAVAAARKQSPETLLQSIVRSVLIREEGTQARSPEDPMIDARSWPSGVAHALLRVSRYRSPSIGSPEFDQMLEEIGEEASDALEQSGLDVSDLVER